MSRVGFLPDEVLKLVMQYVPLGQRLGSCCLVNRGFHAAAVAATGELDLYCWGVSNPTSADSLLMWLEHYGQQLTYLRMKSFQPFPRLLQQLPCPNLQELVLSDGCSLQLGPAADGTPGVIQGCTKLKRLELQCNIIDAPAGPVVGDSLSQLLQLEHLQVAPALPYNRIPGGYSIRGLHSSTLPCLKHLTYLEVHGLSVDNLAQLGCLTNLQELHLQAVYGIIVGPSSVPGFVLPSSLTKLELCSPVEAGLLSLVPTGLKDFAFTSSVDGDAQAHGYLLSSMARLQSLTRLFLYPKTGLAWPPDGPVYSSLTASSSLVELNVCNFHEKLPIGIWQHVFPANRCLLHLTNLELQLHEPSGGEPALSGAWGVADVASFVSCCPNVVEIESLFLQHGPQVSSQLQQLTALTALEVHYIQSSVSAFHESLKGLVAVTQLQQLRLNGTTSPDETTAAALLPLTSLTSLTSFSCVCWVVTPEGLTSGDSPELDVGFLQVRVSPEMCSDFNRIQG